MRGLRARRWWALVVKESLQVVRDPSSILIAFILPLILLFLFGYGVSLDVNQIRIGLVLEDDSAEARELAAAFTHSPFFAVTVSRDRAAVSADLVADRVRGMVVIPGYFGARFSAADTVAPIQVITDGAQPNTASLLSNYAQGVWNNWRRQRLLEQGVELPPEIQLQSRVWFNPELISRNFLVPGSIATIMTLIGTLLTAMVIAREWERGTMEAMLATPVGVAELLAGKIAPYFVLGLLSMLLCTALAVTLFAVPLRGSFGALLLLSITFLFPALGQGFLISALAKNQFVASQLALFSGFLPAMLLSGFIFEINAMPTVVQWITVIVPARYFVTGLHTVFLAGDAWHLYLPSMAAMVAIGAVFFLLALLNTRKRLD